MRRLICFWGLADICWTTATAKKMPDFLHRQKTHQARLDACKLYQAPSTKPQIEMNSLILTSLLAVVTATHASIIPQPSSVEFQAGSHRLDKTVRIASGPFLAEAQLLAEKLSQAGFAATATKAPSPRAEIIFTHEGGIPAEGYVLNVATNRSVIITASDAAGAFWATQTLLQLLPPEVLVGKRLSPAQADLPAVKLADQPRFAWRGLMMDSSRHFQTADDIKHWLDLLAIHKMNVFHWHFVDDHGWRFESKKYPLLTQIGAWREQPPIGRYGGYYTQQEMRDIVAYAAARHITVVPEIEMPGHSRAVLAAYPNLACGGAKTVVDYFFDFPMGATRFPSVPGNNVFCAGKPETYRFLEDILAEVMDIFPSAYIHVGGDEVGMDWWNKCADCQAMMKTNRLANSHKLQAHLMTRMETFLNAHGRKLIGWDEILDGGLSPNATVMSWRGTAGGIKAAKSGHDAVMSPGKPLYFDHRQSHSPLHPPGFGGDVETLEEVYNYDPVPKELSPEQAKHILGAQANLWTCATPDKERLELFAVPRLCALAEVAWCEPTPKDYAAFQKRLAEHLQRLNVNYWREPSPVTIGNWQPDAKLKDWTPLEFDITGKLPGTGRWQVTFQYEKGQDALEMQSVELLAAGLVIAADRHTGLTGSRHENHAYTLDVPPFTGKLTLRAIVRCLDGGHTDSTGTIQLAQEIKLYATLRARTDLRPQRPSHLNPLPQTTGERRPDPLSRPTGESQGEGYATPLLTTNGVVQLRDERIENILWRVEHGELDRLAPKQILLHTGMANLAAGESVADVAAGIETICVRIHEKLPNAKLFVLGLLPCREEKVDRVNFQLQTRLHPQGWIHVRDLGNKFRNADGTVSEKLCADSEAVLANELSVWLNPK